MGRLARVIAVGVAHHVTQRGNGRRFLLDSDADRRIYLELLQENLRLHEVLLITAAMSSKLPVGPQVKSSFLLVMSDAASTEIAVSERQARPLRQRLPGL